jgi:hypothetical protein
MARNGSGTYNLLTNSWNPATNGVSATAVDWQNLINDVAAALTQSLSADGQTPITGNLNAGNNKITGLAAGSATGDSLRWEQLFSQGQPANLASAATTDIGAQNTVLLNITGTTTITSFGTNYNGPRYLRFDGVLTLTHNATTLILPGGANITTAAGDSAIVVPNGTPANGWRVLGYQKADGTTIATSKIQPISASVSGNALTISASSLTLDFRSTTLGSGTVTTVTGTPANLVISSGSTLGTTNGAQSDIAVLAINNSGTIELAAVNLAGGTRLDEINLVTTTAEGGAGAADSATVVYSTTARTNVAYRVLGIVISTQATAGTWATAPSLIQGSGGNNFIGLNVQSTQIQPISASVAANALTISAFSLSLDFRSTTLGSGAVSRVSGTPANLVISSGSTLGTANGVQSDIAVLAINNAGTIQLAAVNLAGGTRLDEANLITTTAEGGAGAADSSTAIYSTTAIANVAYRVLGIIRSTQATAGAWATAPSLIQGYGGNAALQTAFAASGAAPMYACRAWVNFDGTGTVGLRGSGNVSSITDNGVGDYTVNFTASMPDLFYAKNIICQGITGNNQVLTLPDFGPSGALSAPTASSFRFMVVAPGTGFVDSGICNVSIFR